MATQEPIDPIGWARKPRSQKAFELLLSLVKEKEPAFIEIYENLVKSGKAVGENLIYKWDFATHQWIKN